MGNVSFQKENAGSVTGALGNVVAGIQTNIPKKMEESTGGSGRCDNRAGRKCSKDQYGDRRNQYRYEYTSELPCKQLGRV